MTTLLPDTGVDAGSATLRLSSDEERARRLSALRAAMDRDGLDALVICGRGDLRYRGRVFYVSDVLQISGDAFVVVSSKGDPIFVNTPVVGLGQARLTNWACDFRMSARPGEEIGAVLAELGLAQGSLGVVGMADALSVAHLREMEGALPQAELRDATQLFDDIRRIKSEEELANLYDTSAIFRRVFAALEAEIRPGVQEGDVLAQGARLCRLHGCREVKAAGATTPFGAVSYGSTKQIQPDGTVMVWIESPGPTGYWLELRRCYSFGPPSDQAQRYWELQVEAYAAGVEAARVGAKLSDVMAAVERVLAREGYDCGGAGGTYSVHGIGTDAIEGLWYPGNDRVLQEGEVLSLHPSVLFENETDARRLRFIGITDNVLVTKTGGVRMTYKTDEFIQL